MADLKTQANDRSVQAFLAGVADVRRREDCLTLVQMMQDVTGAPARMWGDTIVGFGSYHYTYASGRTGDWPLIAFSPRKANLTLYIMAGFEAYETLLSQLGKHKTGKSCLYVKTLRDLDMDILKQLMTLSVEHMRATYPG